MLHLLILHISVILLWVNKYECALGNGSIYQSIQDEIKHLNTSCTEKPFGTCKTLRANDSLVHFPCQCGLICAKLGTCCIDSSYISVPPSETRSRCRPLGTNKAVFMVDRCPTNGDNEGVWENLCREDWSEGEEVMKNVPVTSLFSQVTYKNFFCFRCHEATHDFYFWNIKLESTDYDFDEAVDEDILVSVEYDRGNMTWVAQLNDTENVIPVDLSIQIPEEINPLVTFCDTDVISHCSESWVDKDTSDKCEAYMDVLQILKNDTVFRYRNVHCAWCNFEDSNNKYCKSYKSVKPTILSRRPFSFTYLLDINRSGGDKVGKIQKCEDDHLWDPFSNKCRALTCGIPGYVVRDGKCISPG